MRLARVLGFGSFRLMGYLQPKFHHDSKQDVSSARWKTGYPVPSFEEIRAPYRIVRVKQKNTGSMGIGL